MDPASMAIMAAVSTGMSALGSIQQGKAAAASAKYNARVQENNAKIAEQNARFASAEGTANAAIEQQKTRAAVGGIKATQAAKGVDVNTGSAVDVRSSAAELGMLNAISIRSNATRKAYGYQTEAASDRAQADLDKMEGKYASQAGYIDAGTTLLGNVSSGYNSGMWDGFSQKQSLGG